MKRLLLFMILVCCVAGSGFSQYFTGGLALGVTAAQVDGDNWGGYKKIGITGGGYVAYNLNDRWAIQPEILFDQRGAYEADPEKVVGIYNLRINQITAPFFLNFWATGSNQDGGLYFQAGLSPEVVLSAHTKQGDTKFDETDDFNRFGVTWQIGVGYQFNERFGANFRSVHSLVPIDNAGSAFGRRDWHRCLNLTLRCNVIGVN